MVRGSKTGTQVQPEAGFAKFARASFPPLNGGLLL
jgi:hypothetical protein